MDKRLSPLLLAALREAVAREGREAGGSGGGAADQEQRGEAAALLAAIEEDGHCGAFGCVCLALRWWCPCARLSAHRHCANSAPLASNPGRGNAQQPVAIGTSKPPSRLPPACPRNPRLPRDAADMSTTAASYAPLLPASVHSHRQKGPQR